MAEVPTTQEIEADIGAMIMGEEPEAEETTEAQTEVPEDESPDVAAEDSAEDAEDAVEDDDDYEPEGPSVEGDDDLVEVEWDGQLIEAPKSVAEALMRQKDYTQKTQEVAAQRKEYEVYVAELKNTEEKFKFAESIQPDILKAQQLEQQAEQAHTYLRDNIDNLSSVDIEKIRLAVDDARRERDELVQSLTNKQQEFQQAQEQAHQELLKKGTEILRQKIPGWGEQQQKQVRDYATSNGFTEAELSNVVDPRQVLTLWKASQYDALKSGVTPAVKKVQSAPTIKTKGRNPMPKDTRQKLDLRNKLASKKLTDKQKAELIAADFGERLG